MTKLNIIELETNLMNDELNCNEMDNWFNYLKNTLKPYSDSLNSRWIMDSFNHYISCDKIYHKQCETLNFKKTVNFIRTVSINDKTVKYKLDKRNNTWNLYLKNIKFNNFNNIQSIKLQIGNYNDEIPNVDTDIKLLQQIYKVNDDNILPMHIFLIPYHLPYYQDIEIYVTYKQNIDNRLVITGDIYETHDKLFVTRPTSNTDRFVEIRKIWFVNKIYYYNREHFNIDDTIVNIKVNIGGPRQLLYLCLKTNHPEIKINSL